MGTSYAPVSNGSFLTVNMQKPEALPFLFVEEAIKRNKHTSRFQEEIGLLLWERARIELVYIRSLAEWRESVGGKLKTILDKVQDPINGLMLDNIIREAECATKIHQKVHSQMMLPDGPYVSLQRGIGLNKISVNQEERALSEIEKDFEQINKKRLVLDDDIQKKKINIEKMKSFVIESEEQLAKRSRLVNGRRSTRGHRKVDHIINRLSMLRKQLDSENNAVEQKEQIQLEYMLQERVKLQDLYQEVLYLQKKRFELIFTQLIRFASTFNSCNDENKQRKSEIDEMIASFNSINIDDLLKRTQQDIEFRANCKKNGRIFKLQEMFSPVKTRAESRKDRKDIFLSATTLPQKDKNYTNKLSTVKSDMGRLQKSYAIETNLNDSVLVDTFCASSSESIGDQGQYQIEKKTAGSSESSLGSKIETIVIPNEPVSNCKMPPPFPTKDFCVSSEEGSKCSVLTDDPEECGPSFRLSSTCRFEVADEDIGMMRNVKVVATHDFVARKKDQLSFKKGQIIKQKVGENEEGFAYGWIRENILAPKQYGWYPAGIVQFFIPSPRSDHRNMN